MESHALILFQYTPSLYYFGKNRRLTNDVLIADPHQVVDLPSYEDMVPERYSIAFFCNVNKHVMLEPLTVLNGEPAKYPPIKAHDYITERLSSTIAK